MDLNAVAIGITGCARATMLISMMGIIAGSLEAGALLVVATIMASRIAVRTALMAVIMASSFIAEIIATFGVVITARFFVVAVIGFIAEVSTGAVFRLLMIVRWTT